MALTVVATVHIGNNTQYISKYLFVLRYVAARTENLTIHYCSNRQSIIATITQWVQSLDCELDDQEIVVVLPVRKG